MIQDLEVNAGTLAGRFMHVAESHDVAAPPNVLDVWFTCKSVDEAARADA